MPLYHYHTCGNCCSPSKIPAARCSFSVIRATTPSLPDHRRHPGSHRPSASKPLFQPSHHLGVLAAEFQLALQAGPGGFVYGGFACVEDGSLGHGFLNCPRRADTQTGVDLSNHRLYDLLMGKTIYFFFGGTMRTQVRLGFCVGGNGLSPGSIVTWLGLGIFPPSGPRSSYSPGRSGRSPGFFGSGM